MTRPSITELANNPDFISGIYNYCDRWCERCPLTSRCLVYATEDQVSSPEHDSTNNAFWQQLASVLDETRQLIPNWANEAGVDPYNIEEVDNAAQSKRKSQQANRHPLTVAGKKYATAAADWFRDLDQDDKSGEVPTAAAEPKQTEQTESARDVIQWYQYQISVKAMRALSSRSEEELDDPELSTLPKDSDGSAKVALTGIDRSIAAWRLLQLSIPERESSIVPLILQLEHLRHRIEIAFPAARSFARPGFDDAIVQPQ